MAGPFKMKGFSGFGNSPLRKSPAEIGALRAAMASKEAKIKMTEKKAFKRQERQLDEFWNVIRKQVRGDDPNLKIKSWNKTTKKWEVK